MIAPRVCEFRIPVLFLGNQVILSNSGPVHGVSLPLTVDGLLFIYEFPQIILCCARISFFPDKA